jgi:dienelactone hydrolase
MMQSRARRDMSDLSIATPHHHLKAYLARPQGEGPWPGVVVFHDILGLADVTRDHAVPNGIDAALNDACPMARLQGALERRQIDHDVKEYTGAGHSFLDEHKGLIGMLGVVIGASYEDRDAVDARAYVLAFFARHPAGLST